MKKFIPFFLKTFRIREVLLMTGFFLTGSVFSFNATSSGLLERLLIYFLGVFVLIMAIYTFNAFCGHSHDLENERLVSLNRTQPGFFLIMSLVFTILSLFLFYFINPELIKFALIVLSLWLAYSLPGIGLKNFPVSGTIIHFISQIIHFQMGYILFSPMNRNATLISIYFALLFSAGHFHHECIDCEADKKSGIKTSAVYFGNAIVERISFIVFCLSIIYWSFLYFFRIINILEFLPFLIAFLAHLAFYWQCAHHSSTTIDVRIQYRALYRSCYLSAGLVLTAIKLLNLL